MERIQAHSNCRFAISGSVWQETVTIPQNIKRFELNAERVKRAAEAGWLEIIHPTKETNQLAQQIEQWSNNAFSINDKPLAILQAGEIESMALFISYKADALGIDERTARMLIEEPLRLQNYIGMKHDKTVTKNNSHLQALQQHFKNARIIRSVDLMAWAYRHGLFKFELNQTPESLEAALYALKYSGCSVSGEEIDSFIQKNQKMKPV